MIVPTKNSLTKIIYQYFPKNLETHDPTYSLSIENQNLRRVQKEAQADRTKLVQFSQLVEKSFPIVKALDWSYLSYDACYTIRLNADSVNAQTKQWRELVYCISVLVPLYFFYQVTNEIISEKEHHRQMNYQIDLDIEPIKQFSCQQIEHLFDATYLETETGMILVPEVQVQNKAMGEATIYDCLFTPERN